jgi:hypothetical protein
MPPLALALAGAAALVGAVAWAALAWNANFEIGYLAWGIGALVGIAALKCGGRGAPMGVVCAALVLASIFTGKILTVDLVVDREIETMTANFLTLEQYNMLRNEAEAAGTLPANPSDEEIRGFLVELGYYEKPGAVPQEEVMGFRQFGLPNMKEFLARNPPYGTWKSDMAEAFRQEIKGEVSLFSAVTENLNAIDLIFAFLGVTTAFGMVNRGRKPRPSLQT